jgi:prophage regulatory protein
MMRFLRLKDVMKQTGLCRSAVYGLPGFPKPIKLGGTRAVAWAEPELLKWQADQIQARDSGR